MMKTLVSVVFLAAMVLSGCATTTPAAQDLGLTHELHVRDYLLIYRQQLMAEEARGHITMEQVEVKWQAEKRRLTGKAD